MGSFSASAPPTSAAISAVPWPRVRPSAGTGVLSGLPDGVSGSSTGAGSATEGVSWTGSAVDSAAVQPASSRQPSSRQSPKLQTMGDGFIFIYLPLLYHAARAQFT